MYTQCPDCHAAFRVSAEVLKQAAGKVRCGSCSHAFNALEFLSETRPERVVADDAEAPIPELQPDADSLQPGTPPPVSAKQSAALLETLDQLAGSDVRIEDTGVEWRVLDPDDDDDFPGSELFETSRTPVDEFLTATPTSVDAGEIFDEAMTALGETAVDELRFDDDTPLPDDFDQDEPPSDPAESGLAEDGACDSEAALPDEDAAPDTELSDEDGEWADILDEFADDITPAVPPLDAELAAIEDAERRRDDSDSDSDSDSDDDTAADMDAEPDEGDAPDDDAASTVDESENDPAATAPDDETDGSDTRNQPLDEEPDEGEASGADREPGVVAGASEKLITDVDISPGFESIVMEGDFVSSALDNDKLAADIAAAAALAEQAQQARDAEEAGQTFGRSRSRLTTIAVLVALLFVQGLHQSRERLLTIPALERVVGPVYRALGRPVSPAWDVTGWRFEATTGNAQETGRPLTINSRVGNSSGAALPYPLIRITLTNRYEESLGSSLLAPAEYLGDKLDAGARVQPGGSFDAVISVLSPSNAATGFKLNVCYRVSDTDLSCAAGGFK